MLNEDSFVREHMQESVDGATAIYQAIAGNLRRFEPEASKALAAHLNKPVDAAYLHRLRQIACSIYQIRVQDKRNEARKVCDPVRALFHPKKSVED